MSLGSLNLNVSKQDFLNRISAIEIRMQQLQDVILRYGEAKNNLDQFIRDGDSAYQSMLDRIDINVNAAKVAWTSLQELKNSLEQTVNLMDDMHIQIKSTINSGAEAAESTIKAAIKVQSVL